VTVKLCNRLPLMALSLGTRFHLERSGKVRERRQRLHHLACADSTSQFS
jgi:hypothetical protein